MREVFAIYIYGLYNNRPRNQIETEIRNFLEANRGYSGGKIKSSVYVDEEGDMVDKNLAFYDEFKEYLNSEEIAYLQESLSEEAGNEINSDVFSALEFSESALAYLNFISENGFDLEEFDFNNLPDFDNDGIATLEDITPLGGKFSTEQTA